MSDFPGALDTFTTQTDGVDYATAAWANQIQADVLAVETELGVNPAGSATDLAARLRYVISEGGQLKFWESDQLTIAGGSITPVQTWNTVDTEAGAASDNLDTIADGIDGLPLILRAKNSAHVVTIRDGVGNIVCNGHQNIVISGPADLVIAMYDDYESKWLCAGFVSLAAANTWTGVQTFGAAVANKMTVINTTTTLDATHHIVLVDNSGGAITLNLPAAASCSGRQYQIKATGGLTYAVTLDGNSTELIDGVQTLVVNDVTIISTGSAWQTLDFHDQIYGGMYCDDASIAVTLTNATTYYPVTSGLSTGAVQNVTFASASQLVILVAGRYKVDWHLTASNNGAGDIIEGLVLGGAAGTTPEVKTTSANEFTTGNRDYHISGGGFVDCAAGDILRFGLQNYDTAGRVITITHANMTAMRVR